MAIVERDRNDTRQGGRPSERVAVPRPRPPESPRSGTYGDLISHPRLRLWARRAAVAIVAGIIFAVIFNVQVGFTMAIIAVIADSIAKASHKPAAESSREDPVNLTQAQRKTARQLDGLEKKGWRILHARAVPRDEDGVSDGRIDHVAIGPTGIYAIDSEKWDKRLPLRALSHRKLFHGPFNKGDRLDEARWEAEQASILISRRLGRNIDVQPSIAIYGPSISWKVLTVRDVDVYSGGRAKTYLRRRDTVLGEAEISQVAEAAQAALRPKEIIEQGGM